MFDEVRPQCEETLLHFPVVAVEQMSVLGEQVGQLVGVRGAGLVQADLGLDAALARVRELVHVQPRLSDRRTRPH